MSASDNRTRTTAHVRKRNAEKTPSASHTVRIIAGKWRRRVLHFHGAPGLRPTGNRVRETLFNWLQPHIHGARCLDLFAGSGALGIEALSRGAHFVGFAEQNRQSVEQLLVNLKMLRCDAEQYALFHGSALDLLNTRDAEHSHALDIVFIDPPFADALWQKTLNLLIKSNRIQSESLIYVESPCETKVDVPENWHIYKQMKAGSTLSRLYRIVTPESFVVQDEPS